jgi:acyl-CoA synthetase
MTPENKRKPFASVVRAHALNRPNAPAFIELSRTLSWSAYDECSDRLALRLLDMGFAPGERIVVYLPPDARLHIALLAAEKAGVIALAVGWRAALRELRYLAGTAGASGLISLPEHRGQDTGGLFAALASDLHSMRTHIVVGGDWDRPSVVRHGLDELDGRGCKVDEIFLINSTSGTTGMPKCVVHDQTRWHSFHDEAVAAGRLTSDDVFMGLAPPPFGFGLWTTHVTPTLLGAPTVVTANFDAAQALSLIGRHRVTVVAAVSTQLVMMQHALPEDEPDFESLRVIFTGGEQLPYSSLAAFEHQTGAAILQFYGSNETGGFSCTTLTDPQDRRLRTAGRIIECMDVKLFDDAGNDVTECGHGQPGGRGPLLSRGYYNNDAANTKLINTDGYMMMDDIVSIDAEGYLQVIGRKGDFIIRGGKNISCAAVEEAVTSHPDVRLCAVVGAPDEIFGERAMAFVVMRNNKSLDLTDLISWLKENHVSPELFPEYLDQCEALPRSSGEKIAKQALRERAQDYINSSAL